ncbi:MAG: cation diffusion facilitator family transporter [Burkholderiales bacterium]|jgi:cation diffusion facilitator family transporter|nr:cation diffusion facilitator family transporter [Nitrosomonadaceae bacterium]
MSLSLPSEDTTEDSAEKIAARARAATRSVAVSAVVNVALASLQIVAGILTRSQSLIADGLHSLADLVGDVVVMFASRASRKAADTDHPYGHQRFENAASLALGGLLLAVGIGMMLSAVGKINAHESLPPVHPAALWVALGTLVAKELLFRYMLRVAQSVKSSMLVANAWHARSDAASSLVVAIGIGGSLMGYPMLDPIAALIVGGLITKMGWGFGWDALHDLMDRAADDAEVAAIRETILATPGVRGVHDVHTRKMGDMIIVDAHLEIDAELTVEAGHTIAVEARDRVLKRHRVLNLMTHIDPWKRPDRDHSPT